MTSYVSTPKTINLSDILSSKTSFSPNNYNQVVVSKQHSIKLSDLLADDPLNGEEVGSDSYTKSSTHYFIRTKALQSTSYLLDYDSEVCVPVLPDTFVDHQLKAGDVLISKDSNIGEAVLLTEDLPNHMMSNGLYRLRFNENKHYILALIKHDFFKTQLGFMVSKGATIKHAKTLFLDCLIPFPVKDKQHLMNSMSQNTKKIIDCENEIRVREKYVFVTIDSELGFPERLDSFVYKQPKLDSLRSSNRIDAGFYCEQFLRMLWLIDNYKNGASTLREWGYDIGRGQNLQVSAIGKSIYSDEGTDGFYKLARPVNLSDFGTVLKYEYLGNSKELSTIEPGDIVFSAEGSVGKCVMFTDPGQRVITNIHGIVLNKENHNTLESGYVASFLRYLRFRGVLDFISVGGQGGSLAMQYFDVIRVPNFDKDKLNAISIAYNNPSANDFSNMGILQLDEEIKRLNQENDDLIQEIITQHEAA